LPGNSCGGDGAPGSRIGDGTSGRGLPGGFSRGGSVGVPGVAGGISGGSIGINDNGTDAAMFPKESLQQVWREPGYSGVRQTASMLWPSGSSTDAP
jgi:hypothetical protein